MTTPSVIVSMTSLGYPPVQDTVWQSIPVRHSNLDYPGISPLYNRVSLYVIVTDGGPLTGIQAYRDTLPYIECPILGNSPGMSYLLWDTLPYCVLYWGISQDSPGMSYIYTYYGVHAIECFILGNIPGQSRDVIYIYLLWRTCHRVFYTREYPRIVQITMAYRNTLPWSVLYWEISQGCHITVAYRDSPRTNGFQQDTMSYSWHHWTCVLFLASSNLLKNYGNHYFPAKCGYHTTFGIAWAVSNPVYMHGLTRPDGDSDSEQNTLEMK